MRFMRFWKSLEFFLLISCECLTLLPLLDWEGSELGLPCLFNVSDRVCPACPTFEHILRVSALSLHFAGEPIQILQVWHLHLDITDLMCVFIWDEQFIVLLQLLDVHPLSAVVLESLVLQVGHCQQKGYQQYTRHHKQRQSGILLLVIRRTNKQVIRI